MLALAASGCADEADDYVAPLGRAEARLDDPTLISCRLAHPSAPAGNVLFTRVPTGPDTPDRVTAEREINCAVMGLSGIDERTGEMLEVVADARLFEAAGGPSTPMTCGLCMELMGENEDEIDPRHARSQRTTSVSTRVTYPGLVESIGVLYDTPFFGGSPWWHLGGTAPWSGTGVRTSYCEHPPNPGHTWGVLTNPYGYEIEPSPLGGLQYGEYAYQLYDPGYNVIRAASVQVTTGGSPELRVVPPSDTCLESRGG